MSRIQSELDACSNNKERKVMLKALRKGIEFESRQFSPASFTKIDAPKGSHFDPSKMPYLIYRSRDYLVQVYTIDQCTRISVNKVKITDTGDWEDGISWDTLMWIKRCVGYGDHDAVEVYPNDKDVVNVSNIRHLFILNDTLPFIWRSR